ncbi:YpoC family protein [Cytobacillus sp. FJAT-54145]|uniref:YpoC family protein n=1 Tax=Cytobacillus spartinae TaxID=3299023 RepID=A0ABW6KDF5_9BACI
MRGKSSIEVSAKLKHSFLFPDEYLDWANETENNFYVESPLIYEVAFYNGIKALKPWETIEYIPVVLTEWKKVKLEIESKFEKRDAKGATLPMRVGIGLFLELLFWTNGQPVELNPIIPLESLKIKPVNITERFAFILARPNLFHSYKQLAELMVEMEKLYVKSIIVRK